MNKIIRNEKTNENIKVRRVFTLFFSSTVDISLSLALGKRFNWRFHLGISDCWKDWRSRWMTMIVLLDRLSVKWYSDKQWSVLDDWNREKKCSSMSHRKWIFNIELDPVGFDEEEFANPPANRSLRWLDDEVVGFNVEGREWTIIIDIINTR